MHTASGRRGKLAFAAILALGCLLAAAQAQEAPTAKTAQGLVQGVTDHGVLAFKGIPYAAPPVGNLRWRETQAPASWQEVRKADTYGNACTQVAGLSDGNGGYPGPISEDCLYLNIWTPSLDPATSLPVIVWIHGGAYMFGSGGLNLYNGAPLASKGAVFVAMNYRLAQLGFFAHPALERENPGGPANFGLLDQIAALRWVQQNISAFGGDPGNVTIIGQSAGAKSVLALFASPLARGLFHRGIAQSSYILPDATRARALEVGSKVAIALGLNGGDTTMEQLRAVPAQQFTEIKGQGLSNAPVPISGDPVLPQSIQATFAAGKESPLPLILGNTSDDTSVVAAFGIDPLAVLKRLGAAGFLVRALYPGLADDTELARQATRDVAFTMPVRWIADRHSVRAPTWRYYFDYIAVRERRKFSNGVLHGAEIPYFLNTVDIFEGTKAVVTTPDRVFARHASEYVFEFARTGKPLAIDSPLWSSHNAKRDRTLILVEAITEQPNFMRPRLNIFLAVSSIAGKVLDRR